MVTESDAGQCENSRWLFPQWNGGRACWERTPLWCCSNMLWAEQIWLTSEVSLRAEVAEDKLNVPLPMMNPRINRFYSRLFLSTSYEHSNFEILCSLRMFYYNNMELWFAPLFQGASELREFFFFSPSQPHRGNQAGSAHTVKAPDESNDWMKAMTQTLLWPHTCTGSIWRSTLPAVPIAVMMVVRRKVSHTSSASVLNFTMFEQQRIIKYVRFVRLPFENMLQPIGFFPQNSTLANRVGAWTCSHRCGA